MALDPTRQLRYDLSPEAQAIMIAVAVHSQATSPKGDPVTGHHGFDVTYDDATPPACTLICAVCQARLPVE